MKSILALGVLLLGWTNAAATETGMDAGFPLSTGGLKHSFTLTGHASSTDLGLDSSSDSVATSTGSSSNKKSKSHFHSSSSSGPNVGKLSSQGESTDKVDAATAGPIEAIKTALGSSSSTGPNRVAGAGSHRVESETATGNDKQKPETKLDVVGAQTASSSGQGTGTGSGSAQCRFDTIVEAPCEDVTVSQWGTHGTRPQPLLANGKCSSCCPYPKGEVQALKTFTATFQPNGSTIARDLQLNTPFVTNPNGVNFFFMYLQDGESTGEVVFTPLTTTAGGQVQIRINHAAQFTNANPGQPIKLPILAQTNLIEIQVIQDPCAGDQNQYYSISIYQPLSAPNPPPKCGSQGQCTPWQAKLALACLGTGASTLEVACATTTILPRQTYANCTSTVGDGKCSCCCPYPAGDLMQIKDIDISFTPNGNVTQTINPSPIENGGKTRALMWATTGKATNGTLSLTIKDGSVGAIYSVRSNGVPAGNWVQFELNQRVYIDIIVGTNLLELKIEQPGCAGSDVLLIDITILEKVSATSSTSASQVFSSIQRKGLGLAQTGGSVLSLTSTTEIGDVSNSGQIKASNAHKPQNTNLDTTMKTISKSELKLNRKVPQVAGN